MFFEVDTDELKWLAVHDDVMTIWFSLDRAPNQKVKPEGANLLYLSLLIVYQLLILQAIKSA